MTGHKWTRRGVIKGIYVLFCGNRSCRVIWWCNRREPRSTCRGTRA
jgi:hypothetical protein